MNCMLALYIIASLPGSLFSFIVGQEERREPWYTMCQIFREISKTLLPFYYTSFKMLVVSVLVVLKKQSNMSMGS